MAEEKHAHVNIVERYEPSVLTGGQRVYFWTCECGESSGDCFSKYTANRDWQNHVLSYEIMDLLTSRRVMLDANRKAIDEAIKKET